MPFVYRMSDVAAMLVQRPCPLIFLDTAAILDIVRVPLRPELPAGILTAAGSVIEQADFTPRRMWLVTSSNVQVEFERHRDSETANLSRSIIHLEAVAKLAFPERHVDWVDWVRLGLEQRVKNLVDRLVDTMEVFEGSPACLPNAHGRVRRGEPPATRTKPSYMDCCIFEEFLELVSSIRAQGFREHAVFVTPNHKDYGRPPDGHPRIRDDLALVGASYVANLSEALAAIADGSP